jgi:hypothetical protein
MPLLFYRAADRSPPRAWNAGRAALYGALIGVVAAAFRVLAPWSEPHSLAADIREFFGAALAFALLCLAASVLRNFIMRRLT